MRGTPAAAERVWLDPARWQAWMDGFGTLAKLDEGWPERGARLIWDSPPGGRGRVVERSAGHVAGATIVTEVEDERLEGIQRVSFEGLAGSVKVTLELEYSLKNRNPLMAIADLLFIRRALRDSLRRTVTRFGRELEADLELLR